jgi:hypothetical protein
MAPHRRFPGFRLRFPIGDIRSWAEFWHPDNDDAFNSGRRLASGDFSKSKEDLYEIAIWKSPRRAALIRDNTETEIAEALRFASNAKEARNAFAVLMGLRGVGLPMASAVLSLIDPNRYTVIDWRALDALGAKDWNADLNFYLEFYLPKCLELASNANVNLRTIDRALWTWSKLGGTKQEPR